MITWLEKKLDKFLVKCQKWAIKVKQEAAGVNVPQEYANLSQDCIVRKNRKPTGSVTFTATTTSRDTYVPTVSAMESKYFKTFVATPIQSRRK